jgi:hypothetical protein
MFHVLPPTGVVAPGSMVINLKPGREWPTTGDETAEHDDDGEDDEFTVPVPPPGHLSVPSLDSPFLKSAAHMIRSGYIKIASLSVIAAPGEPEEGVAESGELGRDRQ